MLLLALKTFAKKEDEYTHQLKKKPFNFRSIYEKSDIESASIGCKLAKENKI